MNLHTSTFEFHDITLVDESETYVYSFIFNSVTHYAETVANPSARELTDALLTTVHEYVQDRARAVRRDLDNHTI